MNQLCRGDIQLQPPLTARKFSDSPLTDHSDNAQNIPFKINLHFPCSKDLRLHLYQSLPQQESISEKMNRRGISWLLTVSWTKGYAHACIWNAILLFYAYKINYSLRKQEMEAILLVCLRLSSKIHESNSLQMHEILMLVGRPISRDDLHNYQKRILEMVDFNLIILHCFTSIYDIYELDVIQKSLFLCELLSLKNHRIFFQSEKIEKIIRLATEVYQQGDLQEVKQIKQLLISKQSKILFHRYGSQFDVEIFAQLFLSAH